MVRHIFGYHCTGSYESATAYSVAADNGAVGSQRGSFAY